jgi:DNA-binding NtrC family response regulator
MKRHNGMEPMHHSPIPGHPLEHTAPVLIVAEDGLLRQILRAVLADEGYTVREAAHPSAALEALRASCEPMVVLYAVAPQAGGARLLGDVVRDRPLAQQHAFVLLTPTDATSLFSGLTQVLAGLRLWMVAAPFDLETLLVHVALAGYALWVQAHLPLPMSLAAERPTPELLALGER